MPWNVFAQLARLSVSVNGLNWTVLTHWIFQLLRRSDFAETFNNSLSRSWSQFFPNIFRWHWFVSFNFSEMERIPIEASRKWRNKHRFYRHVSVRLLQQLLQASSGYALIFSSILCISLGFFRSNGGLLLNLFTINLRSKFRSLCIAWIPQNFWFSNNKIH